MRVCVSHSLALALAHTHTHTHTHIISSRTHTHTLSLSLPSTCVLLQIGEPRPCGDTSSCHVVVPEGGQHVLVANYNPEFEKGKCGVTGSVAAFKRNPDGR